MIKISVPLAKHFTLPKNISDLNLPAHAMKELPDSEVADLTLKFVNDAVQFGNRFKPHKYVKREVFRKLLSNHPYPISQGPSVPPLDSAQQIGFKDSMELFVAKTEFQHVNDSDKCYEWLPKTGDTLETENESDKIDYSLKSKTKIQIKGPASLQNMSVLYTCTRKGCVIHCPCTICEHESEECKFKCREYPCRECSSQCTQHHMVGFPRNFNPSADFFTLVTDKIEFSRYCIPYSNIPIDCKICEKDVFEHQSMHHIFHLRCKFCFHEARPYSVMETPSLESYKKSALYVKNKDSRTCSYCLKLFADNYRRKNHEKIIHQQIKGSFKCNMCTKTYTNQDALNYHVRKHVEPVQITCADCGKQFVSEKGFKLHKDIVHGDGGMKSFQCNECDKAFSSYSNLNRHMKCKHQDISAMNTDYVDSVDEALKFQCDECDRKFHRTDVLKRHVQTVHSENKEFSCSHCEKKFARKDKLKIHLQLMHA